MIEQRDPSSDDVSAPSDGPIEGRAASEIAADDPHKAEKLTSPSVDGDVDEAEE